jgi:hypothetical protein
MSYLPNFNPMTAAMIVAIALNIIAIIAMVFARLALNKVASSRASRLAASRSANIALAKDLRSSNPIDVVLGSENIRSFDSGQDSNSLRQPIC